MIGSLCAVSYLGVYFARNVLSAVTPHLTESNILTTEFIGSLSSLFLGFYAVGQLINGITGDKIKARYMLSFGLLLAGLGSLVFQFTVSSPTICTIAYAVVGFSLSMIYAPMTKVVAENTEPLYATRCALGYSFSSLFGSPLAGVFAAILSWSSVFSISSISLIVLSIACFLFFLWFEKKGIVRYNQYESPKVKGGGIKLLIKHRIIKFTFVSVITGVIRTSVVFWLPTYFSNRLSFSPDTAAVIFTVTTLVISLSSFFSVFLFERLHYNMDLTLHLCFILSTLCFILTFFPLTPILNIICITLAVFFSNGAATMLWSRYCPSLRDTGMVSAATGFLDFMSYAAAAVSSLLFANAIYTIGWQKLIVCWILLTALGSILCIPYRQHKYIEEV